MTTPSHSARRTPPGVRGRAWRGGRVVGFVARLLRGVLAVAVLAVLVGGLPWALTHAIGWPLPDHLPSWTEIQSVLLGPMTTTFLLDILACASWLAWALFTLTVARCAIDIARDTRMPALTVNGPMRRIAATLISAIVISLLGHRVALAAAPLSAEPGSGDGPEVVATAPAWQHPTDQNTGNTPLDAYTAPAPAAMHPVAAAAVALAPDPETGVHDSLWRIAERALGDGNRWPEIFDLNKGKPQPNGSTFLEPGLIFPGEEFTLPPSTVAPTTPDPAPPGHPEPETTPPQTSPATPDAPTTDAPTAGWNTEWLVGTGLASAISTALVLARRSHRRRYRPGSGDRSDLPVAPVVYQLRLAHLRAEQDSDLEHDSEAGLDQPSRHPRQAPTPPVVLGASDGGLHAPTPVLAVGVRDGREIALNLAAAHGLGLIGAGATAATRALLVTALATTTETTRGTARVVIPVEDLATLLDRRRIRAQRPASLHVVADLDAALDAVEAETLVRAGSRLHAPHGGWPPVVVVARAPQRQRQRLQAVLDNGSTVGVTGLLLGQWAAGITAYVREDGTISTTNPGLGERLRGTRVLWLGADDTTDLLALLHDAAPHNGSDTDATTSAVHGAVAQRRPRGAPERSGHRENGVPQESGDITSIDTKPEVPAIDLEILASAPTPASPPGLRHLRPTTTQALPRDTTTDAPTTDVGTNPADLDNHDRGGTSEAVAPLRISVLGPPRVWWRPALATPDSEVTERDVTAAFQPRARELLVFLALHPDGASREALVAALWPNSSPDKTTNAMNTSLTRLRRAVATATESTLSDVILVGDGRYQLDPEQVDVDYHRFAAAMAARRAAITEHERVDAYRHVVDSYTGPVGDGLSTEWLETAREAIRRDAIDAVAALARSLADQDPRQTLDLLELARAFDPHNELIYRDIMRLQERLGQLDAIPRTLSLLATRLAEVDDQPTPQAVDLADRLRRRHDAPGERVRADRGRSRAG